ncbi:MAG: EAL domain-containing protein [Rouxiella aceris]|uniref:EAL domain-containing protein n=1 Tax=Rouxiella aceris TaxID=2703884 RepID=UPI00284DB3ED|nr:EAL domain-containing protein [Rouxiella aceris]MDR3430569.1 EAL domain-containing protein [Rouxiella aceris]
MMTQLIKKLTTWHGLRQHWYGSPLLCALILLPLAAWLSPILDLDDGRTYLLYLPLGACVALLMMFDWRAIPGIFLWLFGRYYLLLGAEMALLLTAVFLFSICFSWAGYRLQVRHRWNASFGLLYQPLRRLVWLVIVLPTLFLFLLQLLIEKGALPGYLGMVSANFLTLRTLVNYQGVMLGILLEGHLFYIVLRIACKPRYLSVLWAKIKTQRVAGIRPAEFVLWCVLVFSMVILLCMPLPMDATKILLSDYTVTLLLPVLLFGAIRYGYHFITLTWSVTLLILFHYYQGFINPNNFFHNLIFISALMLVFTLCLLLMSAISSRERILMRKVSIASLLDPVFRLANLRAFNRDIEKYSRSVLCFVRVAEMDILSKNYGMRLRIQFKQQLVMGLQPYLQPEEGIYHLPAYDLVLRLNHENIEQRLATLQEYVDNFRLIWNGLPVHPNIGLAWCVVYPPVVHMSILLGELSGIAEISLTTGKPESNKVDHSHVQGAIKQKVELLHRVQRALDNDLFVLLAQPIAGIRGDRYHEILLRMPDEQGQMISPDQFFPVVHEFGLAYQLDMWVLKHTLMFINQYRQPLPSARFAVNFSPSTLCRPSFSQEFQQLMKMYQVEPYQIVLEVTESHLLQSFDYAIQTMRELRHFGCRIAIDDFGTGYATYDRLKSLDADILKIDGSFVSNMLNDPLDEFIISSICQVARMKRLTVVAEYVETEEQQTALRALGVDYMQGYLIGKPQPLSSLLPGTAGQ